MSEEKGSQVSVVEREQGVSQVERVGSAETQLIQMALTNQADISVIERLVDLQNSQNDRNAKRLFNEAMARFQGELPTIEKQGVVDYTSNKGRTYYVHARLEDIAKAIKGPLQKNGLSYRFSQIASGGMITVGCTISHSAGHSEYTEFAGSIDTSGGKDQLKGSASTITYLRRYVLTGALGIVVGGEDEEPNNDVVQNDGFLANDIFKAQSVKWIGSIKSGAKTSGQIIQYVEGKGLKLTDEQKLILNKTVVEK